MNYTMKVGIITCMTCMLAIALTSGGPIRRQASQSEKTFPVGGSVTLLCPFIPDDLWIWVYWKKNDQDIYSFEVKSNTTTKNDTRYEGSNHATRLTINDLKKTDSGIYHCKVVTLVFTRELGQVLLSVTDQEVGHSTTSPGVPFRASTTIPPQPAEDNTIFLVFLIFIPIIFIITTVYLVFKYRKHLPAGFVSAFKRLECACTDLLGSDTYGRDDVDVDDSQKKVQMHPCSHCGAVGESLRDSQESLNDSEHGSSKIDSLKEYADGETGKFDEEGSFIGNYSDNKKQRQPDDEQGGGTAYSMFV